MTENMCFDFCFFNPAILLRKGMFDNSQSKNMHLFTELAPRPIKYVAMAAVVFCVVPSLTI